MTPGARPRQAQPYRARHASREVIAKEVQRQRDLGVIEHSSAEWAFPVVLVPKPDGTMRFCVDYEQLNEVTIRDVHPLLRMDDCIEFLGDAKVLSTLDCKSGYRQIPVADEGRDKTTSVCHERACRYARLPFGLSSAPATFQRAIDMILGGLKWKSLLVYLDNMIVFSQSAGEHVEHLREVFAALSGAGVSLKAKKCHLFPEEVEYLGHFVGPGRLQVQVRSIRRLKAASSPRRKKELGSFLWICNVYRRFFKDYARVARPLAAMTSSKRPDRWGTLSDEAWGNSRSSKRDSRRRPSSPFRYGMGITRWTPMRARGKSRRSCCKSNPTNPRDPWAIEVPPSTQPSGATARRNGSASRWCGPPALLRPYIEGTRFTVRTDHAALKWMLHMNMAHGRLARSRHRLSEFDYVVQTRPGASHHAADTMSRISTPAVDEGSVQDAVPCLALPNASAALQSPPQTKGELLSPLTLAELLEGQTEDGRCKEVRAAMDSNVKSRFREDPNGLPVRTAPVVGPAQVYMRTHMRDGVLMREHYPPQAGDPGANNMYTSMRRWFC